MKPAPSLIDRALEVIKPPPERRDACRRQIENDIRQVHFVHAELKGAPSPAELRRNYYRIEKGMKREIDPIKTAQHLRSEGLLIAGADKLQRQEKVKRGGEIVKARFYVLDQKILDDAAGT
jgi:hypothetical protein